MSTAEKAAGAGLEGYSPSLAFTQLAVGVDNLRYDVFLSPRWQQQARQFLFEQTLHYSQPYLRSLFPSDVRRRSTVASEFKLALGQLLREALHRAKDQSNIELDLLARLGLILWLLEEMQYQFSQLAISCREQVEKQGSDLAPGSMTAFVLQSKVADFQSNKRHILNAVGEKLFQVFEELEENSLQPARAALFGSAFPDFYQVVRNRLVFLDNPNDSALSLEHYVMLGHFRGDLDEEERVCEVMAQLLREQGLGLPQGEELVGLERQRQKTIEELQEVNRRLREIDAQAGDSTLVATGSRRHLRWLDSWSTRERAVASPASRERQARELEKKRQKLAAAVDEVEGKVAFLHQQDEKRLAEALSNPANAERLFGSLSPTGTAAPRTPAQDLLLRQLHARLDQADMLKYILAGYHLKPLYKEFCPPLNPQQLKYAVASRRGWVEFEALLDQFPAQNLPVEKLEELSRRLRRLSRADAEAILVRFARDLMRLRRDKIHQQHLTRLFEKIYLVTEEKTRRLSQMNRTLYEFLLPDEGEMREEQVLTHVVIKADVRDSTGITDELLRRGLNPASHLSLNFYEPVRKLMARYSASKIFIEGDALILGIYETEVNRASQRPVAKACLLAKEIVEVCQVYNQRARENDLPVLELGLGIAYHPAPPHYWEDGESRIMISAALNASDRLASCSRLARRLVGGDHTQFRVFQFQAYPALGGAAEEDEEALIRYNLMGVALSQAGFQKLQQEISLSPIRMSADLMGQRESITLHGGTVPLGTSFEKLIIREARVPRILFPGGHLQEWTSRVYYEVCVDPRLYAEPPTPS
ncbi:MAG TPA: hypothetical protein VJ085_05815 [Candidatus Acidoferrales bacterium]|nr:hypothetical protein [Candidatus Acidoferrales bacterium]